MQTLLLSLIILLSGVICAVTAYWFYSAARERKQDIGPLKIAHRPIRNEAWDRAVQAARNRNW